VDVESKTAPPAEPLFNLIIPRSACPHCKAPITAVQNIPVISYLFLRGRCAACSAPIPWRYPAVELLCGVASATVAWQIGFGWPAACAIVVTWFLLALTFIDVDHQLLPDSLTMPLLWLGLLASLTKWSGAQQALPTTPVSAIAGAAIGYLSLWSIYHLFRLLTGKEGMGYGDFKLLAALGAWLGYQMLLPIILLSACVGAVSGIALIALRRQQRGNPMPFGPFLAIAGWIAMLWGPQLVSSYLGLYGPHR
jgi:leader peptidase (prepilin peptidase)/N-methyltransferase